MNEMKKMGIEKNFQFLNINAKEIKFSNVTELTILIKFIL